MNTDTNISEKLITMYQHAKIYRNFKPKAFLIAKIKAINEFFHKNKLEAAVIGLSGGVDSALVYKLLLAASEEPGSPIKRVLALSMPIVTKGTTGQDYATAKAEQLVKHTTSKASQYLNVDLTNVMDVYSHPGDHADAWTLGQLASVVRTPALYYHAAWLQQQGFSSIVVGTTNRDEGSYIGFFGKASDGMVDLQPIADMHKSEVYILAKMLGVPDVILNEKPKGDVWDGRVDEEMIGAPYWFLEMFLLIKENLQLELQLFESFKTLSEDDKMLFNKYADAIELIHQKNEHKYQVGSPAHFIDVMPRKVPGGWS